ncbi:hypothetical protein VTN96DRAFT_7640 [Rasamsonia emersonii]
MLFNLGLTADAAAAHRHEFSPQAEEKPEEKRQRLPFALPALPTITINSPFGPSSSKSVDDSMPASGQPPLSTQSSRPSSLYSSSDSDGDDNTTSAFVPTRPSVAIPKRSARSKTKTTFQLAHPPGNPRHWRWRLRPRLLLQLQQVGPTSRPVPAFDVLPAAISPRLACKFPKLFGAVHRLGPRDLIVLTSDSYEPPNSGDDDRSVSSEEYGQDQREAVATICQPLREDAIRNGQIEIRLNSGVSWEGTPLPNGSYEFISKGEQQSRKARWVLRNRGSRRTSGSGVSESGEPSKRFTFSMINPNTRRHPVIASMTRNSIDVYEQYSPVSPSEEVTSPVSLAESVGGNGETERELINMEDDLRTLIVVTGVWIAFREGWSKNFSYSDASPRSDSSVSSPVSPKQQSSTVSGQEKDTTAAEGRRLRSSTSSRQPLSINRSLTLPSQRLRSLSSASHTSQKRADRRSASAYLSDWSNKTVPNDLKWTDLREDGQTSTDTDPQHQTETSPSDTRRSVRGQETSNTHAPEGNGDRKKDKETKTKGKRWHRLSAIFGKKRH